MVKEPFRPSYNSFGNNNNRTVEESESESESESPFNIHMLQTKQESYTSPIRDLSESTSLQSEANPFEASSESVSPFRIIQYTEYETPHEIANRLTKGKPYVPGNWAKLYQALPPQECTKVAQEVNQRFRKLIGNNNLVPNPKNPKDCPLQTLWLQLRDKVMSERSKISRGPIAPPVLKPQDPSFPSKDLPLVLAGPIVRRATKTSVWFWIALNEKIIGIYTTMFRYDSEGKILNKIPLSRPTTIIRQLGKNFWVALFEVNPLEGSFPTDTIIGYDVEFQFYNKIPEHRKLSDLKLAINYIPFQLPTLIIGEKNTSIAHGSCRRPGSGDLEYPDSMKDAFGVFDDWMYEKRKLTYERPASLILTGDQIYADDAALPLFHAIQKLSYDIFGYNEEINLGGKFTPTNEIPANNLRDDDKCDIKKYSRRKHLTHYSTSQFGFSTDDGEAHLLSFPEYASMYLLVWSKELWDKYCIRDDEIKKRIIGGYPTLRIYGYPTLWDYSLYVGACRRVMANCATYMIFDDHDVTDDRNLDALWERTTKKYSTWQTDNCKCIDGIHDLPRMGK